MLGERLSGLDTAFLCLESARAPLHLGGLAIFSAPPASPDRLVALLRERVGRLHRLRRRVRPAGSVPGAEWWVEDRHFDVGHHVRRHRLDHGGREEVAALTAQLMAEPLDLNRPLWQLHVLSGLAGGGFALLVKMHHALVDGLRAVELGVGLLDGLTERVGTAVSAAPAADGATAPAVDGPVDGPVDGTPRAAAGLVARAAAMPLPGVRDTVRWAAALVSHPARHVGRLADAVTSVPRVARRATEVVGIAASVLSCARLVPPASPLAVPDAPTPVGRRLALIRLDLADVRKIRRRCGGTDHDVLLAVLAGAMNDWLVRRGQHVRDLRLRALVPVSRRTRPHERGCGNLLSGYLCDLPVAESEPLARLAAVRATMDRNKSAGPARGAGAFPLLADLMPAAVHRLATPLARYSASRLFDTVVTNVPIPSLPLALGGALLRELYPIVPLAHGQGLAIALSAYRGIVHVGLHADSQALPDLDRLADAVPAALADLTAATDRVR